MKLLSSLLFSLSLTVVCLGQTLPSNFEYKRETGQETGIPMFSLSTDVESVTYDAIHGKGFEALGAQVQPERGKYGLLFMNAKPKRSSLFGRSKTCSMKIGGESANVTPLQTMPAKSVSRLYIEFMIIQIEHDVYDKLVVANDVFIKCGNVSYSLDQDNIDALKWFGAEVSKDLKRRNAIAK